MSSLSDIRSAIQGLQRKSALIAAVAGVLALIGWFVDPEQFYQSYTIGFFFVLAIPLGSLGVVMLHHMTGGEWGFAIRRLLEASLRTLPLLAVMALPLLAGLFFGELYPWADAEIRAHDPVLAHKEPYLNEPFFVVRMAIYFAVWIGLGFTLVRLAERHDRCGASSLRKRMRAIAGPGIGLYVITMTFAAFDWGMSLEPHWFSTIYGVMFLVGQVLSTWCFSIVMAQWLAKREPFSRFIGADHFHDLGNLTFAFTMLWAYMAFSQYLIIWSGNLAEETPWYLRRSHEGWQVIAMLLVFFHFLVPFFSLLARKTKRNVQVLAKLAMAIIVLRLVDLYWLIAPAFHEGIHLSWLDVCVPVALFAAWFAFYISRLKGRPLISLQDTALQDHLEAKLEGSVQHG